MDLGKRLPEVERESACMSRVRGMVEDAAETAATAPERMP